MTDEAELVAEIERNPDDAAPFLAYADYLQRLGDPRGALITAMHGGAKIKAAVVKELAGGLAKFGASIKLDAWRLGFVDHVRLIADDESHALRLVDAIAGHASTRFARTLDILIIGKRRSYAAVDARLVELGHPATLTRITLGKPGDHALSPALLARFPRVGAVPRKSWQEVEAALRSLRGAGPSFASDDLGPITTADGEPLPVATTSLIAGLAAEIGRKQPLGLVARLVEDCTPATLGALASALIAAWTRHGEEPREAWVYDAAVQLGGADAARLIGERSTAASHLRAEHAIDSLARIRSPLALLELYATSTHWAARGEYAEAALEACARAASSDVLTLLARTGSDPQDATGSAAVARFRELDARVLELLMTAGWSAPLSTVLAWFARAPRRAWASGLVWRTQSADPQGPPRVFALADDRCVDPAGNAFALAPEQPIALVHVADPVVARELGVWSTWQRERGVAFEQLARTASPHESLDQLAELVEYAINLPGLRARGFRNGGHTNELDQEQRFVKTYRYRSTAYGVTVEPLAARNRVSCGHKVIPAVVRFELARDLDLARATAAS